MKSAVLIIPAAMRDAANAVGMAMGWGPDNYTIPLASDGSTVTYYGCRTYVSEEFIAMLETPPPIPGAEDVIAALIVDLNDTLAPWDHADAAFAAAGLVRATS